MTHETEIRTEAEITADIIEFFENNDDTFVKCIEELDNYNGYLGDDRYYEMEMINELFSGNDPEEILRRAFYGHDADKWNTDSRGQKEYGAFNPNRDYFHFNGYGNLVSSVYKDYSAHLDEYAVREMAENRRYIDGIDDYDELSKLFDELENAEKE